MREIEPTRPSNSTDSTLLDPISRERENFRNLFRQTPEMVCILEGPEHRFEFVNDAHVRVLGFDATGMTVREAQPESVEVHGILDEVYRTGKTAELIEIPVTVTNRLRYFNLTYAAKKDEAGEINGVMILGTEITDQYLNREILKSQNKALEMTMNGVSIDKVLSVLAKALEVQLGKDVLASILLVDKEKQCLRHGAAPNLPETFNNAIDGLKIEENTGGLGTAAFLEQEFFVQSIATNPCWENFKKETSESNLKSCWAKPIFGSSGQLIGLLAIYNRRTTPMSSQVIQYIDLIMQTVALIIERKNEAQEKQQAQAALSQSEELYRSSEEQLSLAVEVAKVGFYDWDINKNSVTFSAQMRKDWGLGDEPVSLEQALDYIHEEDRVRVANLIKLAVEEKKPYHTEYRIKRPDGQIAWMDVRGQIHRDQLGQAVRFFGTSIEITERKNREASLEEAQVSAESASAAKGLFLANMSHEIRTPLGAITGFLELLKDPKNSHDQQLDYIGVIDRNSKQLLRIVDDVLDLSKIEAGKFVIESIEFCLVELLKDFSSLMEFKANEKGLLFELEFQTHLPSMVVGDPTRLRQILTNVVGNAIKFTDKGKIGLFVNFQNEELKLTVKDTGCGIAEEAKDHLFKPFSQADNSTTRLFGGTGLGLSLTKRLSEAMNGNFYLKDSSLNQGSTFVIQIPFEASPSAKLISPDESFPKEEASTHWVEEKKVLTNVNVLLVEDAPDNQRLMTILLEDLGASVEIASDGKMSLEMIAKNSYDIILMDIQMPVMDGHEATRHLRSQGINTPIVALTAHAMKEEQKKCSESGFTDFLSKPINKKSLMSLILRLLNKESEDS